MIDAASARLSRACLRGEARAAFARRCGTPAVMIRARFGRSGRQA
ncbi:Hypothetical protein A7982_02748 [Minicystis rosea]|nr:Hypothetical protein A7982_02748 [Minicystis rosea]